MRRWGEKGGWRERRGRERTRGWGENELGEKEMAGREGMREKV